MAVTSNDSNMKQVSAREIQKTDSLDNSSSFPPPPPQSAYQTSIVSAMHMCGLRFWDLFVIIFVG